MFLKLRALLLANDTKDLCCGLVLDDVADGGLDNCNTKPPKSSAQVPLRQPSPGQNSHTLVFSSPPPSAS